MMITAFEPGDGSFVEQALGVADNEPPRSLAMSHHQSNLFRFRRKIEDPHRGKALERPKQRAN